MRGKSASVMAKRGKSPKDTLKGPRLRREDRLVRRFYEPLVLLNILDRNSEQRIYRCPSQDNFTQLQPQELRRTFLGQLAYVCDYAKGGDTVTAIALQGQPSGVTFWVASNKNMSDSTIFFLRGILNTLHNIASSHSQSSELENELAKRCIKFNLCRLKTYQDFMRKNITRCLELLSKSKASNGMCCGLLLLCLIKSLLIVLMQIKHWQNGWQSSWNLNPIFLVCAIFRTSREEASV